MSWPLRQHKHKDIQFTNIKWRKRSKSSQRTANHIHKKEERRHSCLEFPLQSSRHFIIGFYFSPQSALKGKCAVSRFVLWRQSLDNDYQEKLKMTDSPFKRPLLQNAVSRLSVWMQIKNIHWFILVICSVSNGDPSECVWIDSLPPQRRQTDQGGINRRGHICPAEMAALRGYERLWRDQLDCSSISWQSEGRF